MNCHINPRCAECGKHLSQEYNAKTASPEVPKPPPKCANCGLEHPLN